MEAENEILKVCHILLHVPTKIDDTKCTIVFQILITCMKGFYHRQIHLFIAVK